MDKFRVGFGYDVHQLVNGRDLIIGGVNIPFHKGALGHSDADVLLHALTDALLGAAGLGDIGTLFPDTDPKFKDIDSRLILKTAFNLVKEQGYSVQNTDATVVLQEPKLAPYIQEMKTIIAEVLETGTENISVKATTTEHLGIIGNGAGIAAYAVVSLKG
jgi:2-C-methyl-D-erythritol 2,4-cyclodiphosphate synthase